MAPKVVSVGELLFDVFPEGERLGGAPANFAWHASSLGAHSSLVSSVGDDARGRLALETLSSGNVNVDGVRVCDLPTGTVAVSVTQEGQPAYEIVEDVAWDAIESGPSVALLAKHADVVCWGTLGQRSCRSQSAHRQLFGYLPEKCIRVFDVNIREPYYSADVIVHGLTQANLLKLNDQEVPILRGFVDGSRDDRDYLRDLRRDFDIETIVLTLGQDGCRVLAEDTDFKAPGFSVEVVNTVGAGDAFTAAFVTQLLAGADLKTCAVRANQVGAFVSSQDSGMPILPDSLRE